MPIDTPSQQALAQIMFSVVYPLMLIPPFVWFLKILSKPFFLFIDAIRTNSKRRVRGGTLNITP